jgi:hypothetical protein
VTLILALFGVLAVVAGIVLFLKGRKLIGGLLILVGIAWVGLSVFVIQSFHP